MRWRENKQQRHWARTARIEDPLPPTDGGKRPSIPALWERAKSFFAHVLAHVGPLDAYSQRIRILPVQRRELLNWLRPAELTVRMLLLAKAIAWLTMTPEGRKVLHDTPKRGAPARPLAASTVESIPHPGWNTIARHRAPATPEPEPAPARDKPKTCRCAFQLLRYIPDRDIFGNRYTLPPKTTPKASKFLLTFDTLVDKTARQPREPTYAPQGALFAARIEALGRVLADPARDMRRLARLLASLDYEGLYSIRWPTIPERIWFQGERECHQSWRHFSCARRCLGFILQPRPG